ncbi:uncharacterized protein LOC108664976 [Hyalella azteca]|uniref:Uncharacterized protein LOC108664976 n=1 Tax=Hyalella azteca TaxID=294128 RepID=A0A8B7N0V5_HYAAZ|nr:uncharacterized protein LOC108664976 [Hyalella azteca]
MSNSYRRENGMIMMTEEEAKEVQNVQCRSRDFWTYDLSANKEVLQAALDVLHNCTPGNKFTVEYKDCQNSCRLVIFCHPCNTELSSLDPFISHAAGKNHKKVKVY